MKKGCLLHLPKSQDSQYQIAIRPAGTGQGWASGLTDQPHTIKYFQVVRIFQVDWSAIMASLWQANQTWPILFSLLTILVG